MEKEINIQNEIRIWCGEHNIISIRINVGKGYTKDGRYFDTGAPNGHPDLYLLPGEGNIIYVETKAPKGKLREDQKKLHAVLRAQGYDVIVPRSVEQFINELIQCKTLPQKIKENLLTERGGKNG